MTLPCPETPHVHEVVQILRETGDWHTVRCLAPIVSFGDGTLRTALWSTLEEGLVERRESSAGSLWRAKE